MAFLLQNPPYGIHWLCFNHLPIKRFCRLWGSWHLQSFYNYTFTIPSDTTLMEIFQHPLFIPLLAVLAIIVIIAWRMLFKKKEIVEEIITLTQPYITMGNRYNPLYKLKGRPFLSLFADRYYEVPWPEIVDRLTYEDLIKLDEFITSYDLVNLLFTRNRDAYDDFIKNYSTMLKLDKPYRHMGQEYRFVSISRYGKKRLAFRKDDSEYSLVMGDYFDLDELDILGEYLNYNELHYLLEHFAPELLDNSPKTDALYHNWLGNVDEDHGDLESQMDDFLEQREAKDADAFNQDMSDLNKAIEAKEVPDKVVDFPTNPTFMEKHQNFSQITTETERKAVADSSGSTSGGSDRQEESAHTVESASVSVSDSSGSGPTE